MEIRRKWRDIAGQKYGRVTALRFVGSNDSGNAIWRVRCDCGVEFETLAVSLKNGKTKSCGCYRNEIVVANNKKRKLERL